MLYLASITTQLTSHQSRECVTRAGQARTVEGPGDAVACDS